MLGRGGGGEVTLWEYNGLPQFPQPINRKVAVKRARLLQEELTRESRIMGILNAASSDHVVRLLRTPNTLTQDMVTSEGLPQAWIGLVNSMNLEYCPQGSLRELTRRRRVR